MLLARPAAAQTNEPPPPGFEGATVVEKPNAQVPLDLEFRDEDGRTVRLGDFFKPDRPVLLILVYFRCPMLCNLTLNGVVKAIRPLRLTPGKDFEIVTVSFDPREGPELAKAKKANYLQGAGQARGRRRLALPDQQPARERPGRWATPSASATSSTPRARMYLHQAAIYVCTPAGRVARTIQGVEFDSDVLRDSLIDASAGQDQFRAVRRGPLLRPGPFRSGHRQVHLGGDGDHAGDRHPDGARSSARSSAR